MNATIIYHFLKFWDLDEASWEVLLLNAMLAFTLNVLIALTLSLGKKPFSHWAVWGIVRGGLLQKVPNFSKSWAYLR